MTASLSPPVVVGVDSSSDAFRAAQWAAGRALEQGRSLRVVHAWDIDVARGMILPAPYMEYERPSRASALKLVDEIVERLRGEHPGMSVIPEVIQDDTAVALVEASRTTDLLVVGTRGHGGFAGLALGSVSLKLAAHSHCPTAIVPKFDETSVGPSRDVVLGVVAAQPREPIAYALTEAVRLNAKLRVIHAWKLPEPYDAFYADMAEHADTLPSQQARALEGLIEPERSRYPSVTVVLDPRYDYAAHALIEASARAHLVVVGAHRRHGPLSVGVGKVLRGLLGRAHCPVVVVPIA